MKDKDLLLGGPMKFISPAIIHDDADGLSDLHDTGVHQTHQHDRHSGGGLNGDGDAGTQQQTFDGVGSHALEQPLQLAAGHFFQTFGHDRHAV